MSLIVILFLSLLSCLQATEGAFPLYLNGYMGPKAGYMPPPGLYFRNDIYHHPGHLKKDVLGGVVTGKCNAKISFDILSFTYISHLTLLDANVGCGVIAPFGRIDVHATLSATVPTVSLKRDALGILRPTIGSKTINKKKHQVAHGIADTLVIPFMLGWHSDRYNLHVLGFQGLFLPTGSYTKGKIANMGQNHFATETDLGFTWLNPDWGTEVSALTGITVNFTNHKIHYRSGSAWHTDFFVGQYLTKQLQVGLSGYWFYQLTPDSGTGSKVLGGFRSRALGLGPSISYEWKLFDIPVTACLRYFKESDTKNYLKGETFYLTLQLPLF